MAIVADRLDGEDKGAWSASIAIAASFAVLLSGLFWFGSGPWVGALHAGSYGDLAQLTGAAQDVWHGRLREVYGANLGLLALPLSFLAVLPLAPILSALHEPIPYHDLATLLAGFYILLLGCFVLHAVRRLAWDVGIRRHLLLVQSLAAIFVLLPEFEYGHLDDVLALAAVTYAVRHLLRREPLTATLLLSVAISFKQWAFMLVPLFVASTVRGRRIRAFVVAAALPAILMALCIAVDRAAAVHAFFLPPPSSQLTGHPGFDPTWLGAQSSEASRSIAALLAFILGLKFARIKDPGSFLAGVALIFMIRPLTETVNYSYYWSPAFLFVVISLFAIEGKLTLSAWVWPLGAIAWAVPRGLDSSPTGWWACQLILLAGMGVKMTRVHTRSSLGRRPAAAAHGSPNVFLPHPTPTSVQIS